MTSLERILKAAEDRIRVSGYNGFSFRDIARDTGMTNAGVHHHFPTKAALVACVVHRYAARFFAALEAVPPVDRVACLRALFVQSLKVDGKMCLCGLLAAEVRTLPESVADEVNAFFKGLADRLLECFPSSNDPESDAVSVLAQLEGAILLAHIRGDERVFDQATRTMAVAGPQA